MKLLAPARLETVMRTLWALVLVTLPVTSFRFIPFLGAGTQVRPLSIYPAVFLLVLLAIRCIRERKLPFWSEKLLPLLPFLLAVLISSVIGFFLAPLELFQYTYVDRAFRAWTTLAVGMIFLLLSIAMNLHERDLKFTLKWLFIGFAFQAGWSLLQLFGFYFPNDGISGSLTTLLDFVQNTLFVAGLAPHQRISGLTLEPSWLAAQIVTIYLPWSFAALLIGYRWGRRGWLAPAVLVTNVILLLFTFSRSGILFAVVALFLTFLFAGRQRIRQLWQWFLNPFRVKNPTRMKRRWEAAARIFLLAAVLAGLAGGITLLVQNSYFALFWTSETKDIVAYVVDISAGPRLAYAWAGWEIFTQHPWTGVGLGAAGLYIRDAFPEWSHFNVSEVSMLLAQGNTAFPNTKNLFIRLLAETGIIGFWLFISFYLSVLGKVLRLLHSRRKVLIFIGTAGMFSWLAIVLLGFTQDSFAMPLLWLSFGILLGMKEEE